MRQWAEVSSRESTAGYKKTLSTMRATECWNAAPREVRESTCWYKDNYQGQAWSCPG